MSTCASAPDRVRANKYIAESSCPVLKRQTGYDLTDLSFHLLFMGIVADTINLVYSFHLGNAQISDITGDHTVLIKTLHEVGCDPACLEESLCG